MSGALELALAAMQKNGAMRTPAIAAALGLDEAEVEALLAQAAQDGRLTTCAVEAGGRRVTEYRCSASGGRYDPKFVQALSTTKLLRRPPSVAPTTPPPGEEEQMNLADSITAAFKEHGPMSIGQLSQHVTHEDLPDRVRQLAGRGALAKLGGKTRAIIYGLPDQTLPEHAEEPTAEAAPRPARGKKSRKNTAKTPAKKARKRRVKRIGRRVASAAAKKAWATRRAQAEAELKAAIEAARFRPLLACDGALLLTGAEKLSELNKAETKVLVEFIRSLDKGEVAA